MNTREEQLIDLLESLLYTYGMKTPLWDKVRVIVDQERPIVGERPQEALLETVTG